MVKMSTKKRPQATHALIRAFCRAGPYLVRSKSVPTPDLLHTYSYPSPDLHQPYSNHFAFFPSVFAAIPIENMGARKKQHTQKRSNPIAVLAHKEDLAPLAQQESLDRLRLSLNSTVSGFMESVLEELKELRHVVLAASGVRPEFLSPEQFVKFLGGDVTARTIRRWCNSGQLKSKKIGEKWFILSSEVDEILKEASELEKEVYWK